MSNKFKQSAFLVVEVKTVKKEAKKTKADKPYDQYSIFGVTVGEGVGINIRKAVYNPDTMTDFVKNKIAGYENMKEAKEAKQKVYAFVVVNPATKDGKTIMYDKVSTYSTDEGKSGIVVEGWATAVEHEDTEDGLVFNFKNSTKTKAECASNLEVDMLVSDKNGNEISLIDDETSEYPINMSVYLKDGIENNAVIGQGYRFSLQFEKGIKKVSSDELSFDEEAKDEFTPDILRVVKVGKIKDYTYAGDAPTGNDVALF